MKFSTRTMRTLPKTCAALGAAALMMGAGASQAHAAGSTLIGNGLHISTGAIVDPDGRTWVSDHNAGFCRVARPSEAGEAGTIEHPQVPGQLNLRTCLGGLLPDPQPGPDAAGAPAFLDPSPEFAGSGDELVFIPDGASPSSEVVRAQWNRNTGLFEYKDTVTMNADRGRPVSASVGPDENVYVSFQRETTIQRITEATSEAPIPEIVGVPADGRGAAAVAAGRDADGKLAVYVAESTGIRVLHPNPATAPTTQPAFDIPGPGGLAVSALSYDSARKLLWAGTAGGVTQDDAGNDSLVQIDIASGAVDAAHTTGFSMIGGVAAKADGNVLVLDDPALLDPSEPMGTGRLFSVGLPAAHVTRGPIDDLGTEAADRLHTKDTAPTFEVSGEGRIQCRVRGGSVDTGWVDCPEDGLYTVDRDLADGRYTISVRSIQDGVTGLPEAHVFTVDNAAPAVPKVVRPAAGSEVSGSPWFELAGDADASFLCKFDDETEGKLCKSGYIRQFSDAGDHTIAIASVDAAGNVSDYSAPVPFTVNPLLPPNTPTGWSDGTPSHRGSSLYTEGLHISAGALVAPDGSTWVADHNGGFCRVTEPGEDGPGVIEHPQVPGAGGPRTCLGGLLPEAGTGPDAAGQPALVDPTSERPGSGDEIALIPDGASPSSEVVRAQWNPDSGLFEYKDTISTIGDRTRPVAVSLGPDGAAYVVFQRSGTIQRITDPAGTSPAVETVGLTANGRRATTVAAGRDAQGRLTVYVAEDAGLTRVAPDARAPRVAQPAIALPGAPSISALTYDTKRDHLWVGTANGTAPADAGKDVVHRIAIRTGEIEENYATGYSMVGGFGLRPDGVMFVLDDPAILDPAEPMGTGRMFHVGLPAAHITRGPLLADGVTEAPDRAFVNVDRPTFLIEGDESKQCRLTGEGLPGAWEDCPADGRYRPATALADGRYTLAVRSVVKGVAGSEAVLADDGTEVTPAVAEVKEVLGLVEVHRFTVDTEKPAKPSITSPTGGTVSATPWFVFDAEAGTRLECSWNDAPEFTECVAGKTRTFTANAEHTLKIRAIDRAGNVSPESDEVRFNAHGQATKVTIDAGPEGRTTDSNPTFRFSADAPGVQFSCRISGQEFALCNGGTKSYSNLAEGTYVFEVRAKDDVGNITPVVKRTFTVDRTAPVISASLAEGARTGTSLTVAMAANEAVGWQCSLDGAPLADCGNPVTYNGLTPGEHVFQAVAIDTAGNRGEMLTRRFTVEAGFVPAPPATQPVEPTVTVVDEVTKLPLTIRTVDIDRRVDLQRIQQAGIRVTVRPATGAKLIRFRIFKVRTDGDAAAAATRPVVTIYRTARKGTNTIRLTRKELRGVRVGSYRMEISAGHDRKRLGKSVVRAFRVTR